MIPGFDSSLSRPTKAQAQAMYDAGVRVYGVYMATRANVGLLAPWSLAEVQVLQQIGFSIVAFVSGNDDPVAVKVMAGDWKVLHHLDDEPGIRAYGSWEQPWLDTSGAGLYGLLEVHQRLSAPSRIVAMYPGYDPLTTWPTNPPAKPHGWQWRGTHDEFGVTVDSLWLDDWFAPPVLAPAPVIDNEDGAMPVGYIEWGGQGHAFWVNGAGDLVHRWIGAGQATWGEEVLAHSLPSDALVNVKGYGQLHVWVRTDAPIGAFHAWFDGSWHTESI